MLQASRAIDTILVTEAVREFGYRPSVTMGFPWAGAAHSARSAIAGTPMADRSALRIHIVLCSLGHGTAAPTPGIVVSAARDAFPGVEWFRALRIADCEHASRQRRLDTGDAAFVANARRTSSCRTPTESAATMGSPDVVTWRPTLSVTSKRPPPR